MEFKGLREHGFDPDDLNKVRGTGYWKAIAADLNAQFSKELKATTLGRWAGKWIAIIHESKTAKSEAERARLAKMCLCLDRQEGVFFFGIDVEKGVLQSDKPENVFDSTWDWNDFRDFLDKKKDEIAKELSGWLIRVSGGEILCSEVSEEKLEALPGLMERATQNSDWVDLCLMKTIPVKEAADMGPAFLDWVVDGIKKAKPVLEAFTSFTEKGQEVLRWS